jgi:hypothetical protein
MFEANARLGLAKEWNDSFAFRLSASEQSLRRRRESLTGKTQSVALRRED